MRYILLIFCTFLYTIAQAQNWSLKLSSNVEIVKWKLTSTYEKEERSLQGASIVLTKGGQVVAQTTSEANGNFSILVPPNGEFLLTVSYPGCNTKRFSVNTFNVPEDFAKNDYKPTFSIGGFIMAKPFPGIDYSGLQQALVKVEFKQKKKVFDHDDIVTQNGLDIVTKIYQNENTLIQSFCSTNKSGDVALAKPDCPLAKSLYEKAISIIPGENYPVEQLKKVGDCLKNKEAEAKKAEEKIAAEKAAQEKAAQDKIAAEKLAQEKAAQEKLAAEKALNDKIAADKAAKKKAEEDKLAKQKEGLAKAKAEDEAEAKAIEEKRLAKEKAAQEKLAADKEKKKKAEAEKLAKQKEGMAKAKAEDEAEAKAIEEKRKKRQAEEDEAKKLSYETKSTDTEGDMGKRNTKHSIPGLLGVDKYKENIKKADDYFKMKRWAEAKTAYEDALKIKAEDAYALSKLEEVNKKLENKDGK